MMGFIDQIRTRGVAVESVCRVLTEHGCQVAARTYRAWRTRPASLRAHTHALIEDVLRATVGTPEGLYGRRKMHAYLNRAGHRVAACTVDRLMRDLGLNGLRRGKPARTTVPAKDADRPEDLVNRQFHADAPDRLWVMDFTYVRTWSGFVYVAFIVDVYAQRILAWHASTNKRTQLVLTPLRMAMWERARTGHPVTPGRLTCHHDAGSQYVSVRFAEHLALEDIAPSVGTVGDAYDNCLMESIIGLYKNECLRSGVFTTDPLRSIREVEFATMAWVDWYNHRRLHTTCGLRPPAEAEHDHHQNLQPT